MSRKVKVFNSETQSITEVQVNGTTWGELKLKLSEIGINTSEMKATIRETGSSFETDSAEIPQGKGIDMNNNPNGFDCTIFLNPIKTKSGK